MADATVKCVSKVHHPADPHQGITHLGGDGWRWTTAQVIESINLKTNTFHTLVSGRRAEIGVVNAPSGPYLRTYADGVWNDNLLALPVCI
jgi:hypothetical protein